MQINLQNFIKDIIDDKNRLSDAVKEILQLNNCDCLTDEMKERLMVAHNAIAVRLSILSYLKDE